MTYNIIQTGSKGNGLVIDDKVLIDCGVSFVKLKDVYKKLQLVLLTHIHGDHFHKTTISTLAKERPTLRFGCCEWLVEDLIKCGVNIKNIDVFEPKKLYNYGLFEIMPILLYHNVPQCGYRMFINGEKLLYATDTNKLDGIEAKGYDYYFIEANHTEEGIKKRIEEKERLGMYVYEYDAMENHLSQEKCDAFLIDNANEDSKYIYLHGHIDEEVKYDMENVEVLEVYTDGKGKEHNIDEMANRMIYFTMRKYGKADLDSRGYSKIVERFDALMKEIDVMELIKEKKEEE